MTDAHAVEALAPLSGWTPQTCADAAEAAALFDRLRPYGVALRRYAHGRLVETYDPGAGRGVDPGPD